MANTKIKDLDPKTPLVATDEFPLNDVAGGNLDVKGTIADIRITQSQITDTTITATNLNILDDGVDTTLHFHDSDRARANHTGTQTISTLSDLDTGTVIFSNKTIDGDVNTIIDINETQMNVSVGASGTILTSNGVGVAPTYQSAAGGAPFTDTTSIVEGSDDATKEIRFEVDGLTTGTIRVITPPDKDITLVGTNDKLDVFAATTKAELETVISDVADFAEADGDTYSGAHLFNAATMRIPLSATPTMVVDGDFAIDTTITDFSMGLIKYFDGEEMAVISVPIAQLTTPTDGHVISYNATNDEFELVSAGAADNLGDHTATQDIDFANFDGINVDNLLSGADNTHNYDMERAATLADDTVIGNLRFRANDGEAAPVVQNYAGIVGTMEDDAIGAEDGSLKLQVTEAGTHDVDYMTFNDASSGTIVVSKTLDVGTNIIQFANTDATIGAAGSIIQYDVGAGFGHRFRVNDVIRVSIGQTGMVMSVVDEWSKGTDVVSATEIFLGELGNLFDITGTTTINTIDTGSWQSGTVIILKFDGILTVTNEAGGSDDFHLGDGKDFVTAVGDTLTLIRDTAFGWHELSRGKGITASIGIHDIYVDGGALKATTTNGATDQQDREIGSTNNEAQIVYCEFADAAENNATAKFSLPRNWDRGTFDVVIHWTSTGDPGVSDSIRWEVKAKAVGAGDAIGAVYGTAVLLTDTPGNEAIDDEFLSSPLTITAGGTPADADMIYLNIARLGADGADDFAAVAQVLGLSIRITTDAATAA